MNNAMQNAMARALHVEENEVDIGDDGIDFAMSVSNRSLSLVELELRGAELVIKATQIADNIKALEATGANGFEINEFAIFQGADMVVDGFATRDEAKGAIDYELEFRDVPMPREPLYVRRTFHKRRNKNIARHMEDWNKIRRQQRRNKVLIQQVEGCDVS